MFFLKFPFSLFTLYSSLAPCLLMAMEEDPFNKNTSPPKNISSQKDGGKNIKNLKKKQILNSVNNQKIEKKEEQNSELNQKKTTSEETILVSNIPKDKTTLNFSAEPMVPFNGKKESIVLKIPKEEDGKNHKEQTTLPIKCIQNLSKDKDTTNTEKNESDTYTDSEIRQLMTVLGGKIFDAVSKILKYNYIILHPERILNDDALFFENLDSNSSLLTGTSLLNHIEKDIEDLNCLLFKHWSRGEITFIEKIFSCRRQHVDNFCNKKNLQGKESETLKKELNKFFNNKDNILYFFSEKNKPPITLTEVDMNIVDFVKFLKDKSKPFSFDPKKDNLFIDFIKETIISDEIIDPIIRKFFELFPKYSENKKIIFQKTVESVMMQLSLMKAVKEGACSLKKLHNAKTITDNLTYLRLDPQVSDYSCQAHAVVCHLLQKKTSLCEDEIDYIACVLLLSSDSLVDFSASPRITLLSSKQREKDDIFPFFKNAMNSNPKDITKDFSRIIITFMRHNIAIGTLSYLKKYTATKMMRFPNINIFESFNGQKQQIPNIEDYFLMDRMIFDIIEREKIPVLFKSKVFFEKEEKEYSILFQGLKRTELPIVYEFELNLLKKDTSPFFWNIYHYLERHRNQTFSQDSLPFYFFKSIALSFGNKHGSACENKKIKRSNDQAIENTYETSSFTENTFCFNHYVKKRGINLFKETYYNDYYLHQETNFSCPTEIKEAPPYFSCDQSLSVTMPTRHYCTTPFLSHFTSLFDMYQAILFKGVPCFHSKKHSICKHEDHSSYIEKHVYNRIHKNAEGQKEGKINNYSFIFLNMFFRLLNTRDVDTIKN